MDVWICVAERHSTISTCKCDSPLCHTRMSPPPLASRGQAGAHTATDNISITGMWASNISFFAKFEVAESKETSMARSATCSAAISPTRRKRMQLMTAHAPSKGVQRRDLVGSTFRVRPLGSR